MVKVRGPLFSMGASGTLGRAISYRRQVFGSQVEKKPQKRDLKSPAQVSRRELFLEAVAHWNSLSDEERAAYRGLAAGLPMTGFNLCVQDYLMGRIEVGVDVQEGGVEKVAAATVLDFTAADFMVTDEGDKKAGIAIDYTNSKIARKDQDEVVTGHWQHGYMGVEANADLTAALKLGFPPIAAPNSYFGVACVAGVNPGKALTRLGGLQFDAYVIGGYNLANMEGVYCRVGALAFSGTLTEVVALKARRAYWASVAGATVPRAGGVVIDDQGYQFDGSMDKLAGLVVAEQTGSATEKFLAWLGGGVEMTGTPVMRVDSGAPSAGKTGVIVSVGGTLYRLIKDDNDFVKMEAV